MDKKLLIQLLVLFLVTQVLGILVTIQLINANVHTAIVTDNPDDIQNSIGLIFYILFFTVILLIIITFVKKKNIFKMLELFTVFGTSMIVFAALVPELAIMLTILIILTRIFFAESILFKNIASVIGVTGVGALLGVSLGIIPIMFFIILLSIYDIIAVFVTKHMIILAKNITAENLSFTYSLPTKDHVFQLGTGDIVIPLMFCAALLKKNLVMQMPLVNALILPLLVLAGSILGLIITLDYCDRKMIALPALPLQSLLMIIVFLIFNLFS